MALDSKRWHAVYAVSMLTYHFLAFLTKKGDSKDGKPNLNVALRREIDAKFEPIGYRRKIL